MTWCPMHLHVFRVACGVIDYTDGFCTGFQWMLASGHIFWREACPSSGSRQGSFAQAHRPGGNTGTECRGTRGYP